MHLRIFATALALLIAVQPVRSQNNASAQPPQTVVAQLTGVWRGQFDNLPGIDMVISNEGGQLTGAVLFYLHMRKTVNAPYTSTPGLPEPMFNLSFDGKTLRFQVSHHRAHPPHTLSDPPVRFRLTLTGPDKAELVNESEDSGPGFPMHRSAD
jgi:hypothetical protein